MDSVRLLDHNQDLSAAEGLSGDEALALAISRGEAPPTLRLYRYRPCVIVGRYQNLTDAIDLDVCRQRGLVWNRRHTGGGTVLMGPDQVAVALVLPNPEGRGIGSIRTQFEFFAGVLADALQSFGIQGELEGKNDLQVQGRKIAGLAISQDIEGVVFYHASLLLDFDVPLMVDTLRLPTRDLDDKGQSCFSQRMTTVHEHNPAVTFESMKAAIVQALETRMQIPIRPGAPSPSEIALQDRLLREQYRNDDWIFSTRVMRRWNGTAERKTPGGALRVYVSVASNTLDAILISGDYFCRTVDLARLESNLKGTPIREEALLEVVQRHHCNGIYRVEAAELTAILLEAAANPVRPAPLTLRPSSGSPREPESNPILSAIER